MPSDDHREYIKKIVDAGPPLSPEQRARLGELLRPARLTCARRPRVRRSLPVI